MMGAREAGSPQCTTPEQIRLSPHISPIQISPEPPRRTTYDTDPPARRSLSPVLATNEWFANSAPGGTPLVPLRCPASARGWADSPVVSFDDQPGSATSNLSSESALTRCRWSTGKLLMSLGCMAILGITAALVVLQFTEAEHGGPQGVHVANVTSNSSSVSPSPPVTNTQPPPLPPPPPPYFHPVQIPPLAQQPPTSPRAPLATLPNLRILPEAYTINTCNTTAWGAYWPVPFGRAPPEATSSSPPESTRLDTITGTWVVVREQGGRREVVRQAMRHAWGGYVAHAWGYDELKPVSRKGVNNFGGFGLTIVDSLSTLWLMEMWQEFDAAREWVGTNLTFDKDVFISVFEINIRILGGLLSAYDLSGDRMFLDRATDLGQRMMWAFESPTRVPYTRLNLRTGVGVFHQMQAETSATFSTVATLSEVGTLMLEFNSLTRHTGDPSFERAAARAMELLYEVTPPLDDHLMPIHFQPRDMTWNSNRVVSFGANGDSFYEYLLKASVQRQHSPYFYVLLSMWGRTMDDMISKLTQSSAPSRLQFIAERYYNMLRRNMDHLACFVPGMLLLGDHLNVSRAGFNYTVAAAEYLETCWQMYNQSTCGLAPESVYFPTTPDPLDENPDDMTSQSNPYNFLRPETLESIFIMYRRTGDPKYREMGWTIFQAFETHSKVESGGYSGLRNVNSGVPPKDDQMQSFFLAETLKYLYLLYSDSSVLPLDVWVLNTEAHPLRIQCV